MKLGLYWRYATRSLARGGQRTLLAIFCIAIGVMAIVALQLVGNSITQGLLGNVRDINGGDIQIISGETPLMASDLGYFDQLKAQGTITAYTAIFVDRAQARVHGGTATQRINIAAVHPASFPLVDAPTFTQPANASLRSLLHGDTVVITTDAAQIFNLSVGDTIRVSVQDGRSFNATIGGIVESNGYFQGSFLLIDYDTYAALPSATGQPAGYTTVYVDVPGHSDANAANVAQRIQQQFPLVSTQTTQQLLASNQQQVDQIRYFLQIIGLLALLIGGVGIMNTIQVMLRRRRIEIAMLKTNGYRQRDLYALFGLETGLVGLLGGLLGAAAGVGISFVVKGLMQATFGITLPTIIDAQTVGAGVVVGLLTSLIFGLVPIIQASQVRPQAVLRELPDGRGVRSRLFTVLLMIVLLLLFFGLALSVLQNVVLAIAAVGGTAVFLALLAIFFTFITWLVSKLPVPERLHWWYLLLVAGALAVSVWLTIINPGIGILLLIVSALGIVVVLLPRTWKANVKLALRNVGRQKARTVTTLLALYIGVFAIGLVLVLGQDIQSGVTNFLANSTDIDAAILASGPDRAAVDQQLAQISGVTHKSVTTLADSVPTTINGQPIATFIQSATAGGQFTADDVIAPFVTTQGFDLAQGQKPDSTLVTLVQGKHDSHVGRMLTASDAGTGNVLLPVQASQAPVNLKLGDTFTLGGQAGRSASDQQSTLTVVGFYSARLVFGRVLADNSVVTHISGGQPTYVYNFYLDPKTADVTLAKIQDAVPTIQTYSLGDILAQVNSIIGNLTTLMITLASLALLAALIIIANAVALAMLERRRELGILKAVGHTSRSVLGEVLMENGVIGFIGGLLGMLLVAWGATRVRPLEVLRYE